MSSSETPLVSVVIPTKDRADSLANALDALGKQDYSPFEVIVADNGSTDHTEEVIAQFKAIRVVNPRVGVSRSRQCGIDRARGSIIAMCDDDSVPEPDWITQLVRRLLSENDLALIGGKIIPVGFEDSKGMGRLSRNSVISFVSEPKDADYFASPNLGMRTSALAAIGGYDPFFRTGGFEEPDLILRLKYAGYRVGYEPLAVAQHVNPGVSFRKRQWFHTDQLSRLYFCMKHLRPATIAEWGSFLAYEMRLMYKELKGMPYQFFDAARKRNWGRWNELSRRTYNAVIARLSIPWLLWVAHRRKRKESISGS